MYSQPTTGQAILDLLNSLEIDVEGMRREAESLPRLMVSDHL